LLLPPLRVATLCKAQCAAICSIVMPTGRPEDAPQTDRTPTIARLLQCTRRWVQVDGPEIVDGLPVRRVGKGSRRGAGGPKPPLSATLERPVVNCLACGKVYDCRGTFTSDITAFVGESSPNFVVHST